MPPRRVRPRLRGKSFKTCGKGPFNYRNSESLPQVRISPSGRNSAPARPMLECLHPKMDITSDQGIESSRLILELQERLHLQELVSKISTIFLNLPTDEVDEQIENGLKCVVEFLGIDRSVFGQFDENRDLVVTHHYRTSGIPPPPITYVAKALPWYGEKIARGEVVSFANPSELPPEAVVEKAFVEKVGLKSNLTIPFSVAGSVLCGISLESFRSHRSWPDLLVQQLKQVGEVFAHTIYRKRAQQKIDHQFSKLQNQFQFEFLISSLSARFVNIPRIRVDQEIEFAMGRILQFFQIDRLALLKISKDKKVATVTHSENAEGIPSVSTTINYAEHFPWHAMKVLKKELLSFHTKDLPPEAEIDRKSAEAIGSRSSLVIPLIVNDSVEYVLAVNSVTGERIWENEIIPRLRLMGEIFVHALLRKHAEDELAKSFGEVRRLKNRLEAEANYLRSEITLNHQFEHVIGESNAYRAILAQVEQVAPTDSAVLILGETGTGKEVIARAIHDLSRRKARPMVKVDCATLPSALIESELFGREKGAYTGALTKQIGRFDVANGSTIFLDEIGEMPSELQAKLLRVLEHGEFERLGSPNIVKVNVRLIAATNRDLEKAIKDHTFREDLFYRLNVFPIHLPPLRDHIEDLPLLMRSFLNEFNVKMGKNITRISKDSLELLMRYHWPGNIRELRNVVEHAVIVSNGETLQVRLDKQPHPASTELLRLDQLESKHILEILEKTQWQIKGPNGAAHILGLNPSTLYSKMKKLGIHSSGKSRESRQKRTLAASESTQNEKRRSSNLET